MDKPYSTHKTSRSYTYSYLHIAPPSSSPSSASGTKPKPKPYILFLHGFPSSSYDWRYQVEFLSKKGYGVVVPDLLGYGGTSKPLDITAYTGKGMAEDMISILDHEGIKKVIGVGHDWGSYLLSRLANYHSNRFQKYIFLDVGYTPPNNSLTLLKIQSINSEIKKTLGFEIFGYFLFFDDVDAADLMDAHPESVTSLFYSSDNDLGKEYMGKTGGFRTWLLSDKKTEYPTWLTPDEISKHLETFSISNSNSNEEKGGYAAPINWYRSQLHNVNQADDEQIPERNHRLEHPTLLVSSTRNFITETAKMGEQMRGGGLCGDFREVRVEGGHWIMLEMREEVNRILEEFFEE